MKHTIDLKQPILVDNKEVKKLEYDVELIDTDMFVEAFTLSTQVNTGGGAKVSVAETDASLHLYLGFMAIKACNPSMDIMDLKRIKGMDIITIMGIGRNFTCMTAEESDPSDSDQQSEPTAGYIMPM